MLDPIIENEDLLKINENIETIEDGHDLYLDQEDIRDFHDTTSFDYDY